VSKPVVHGFQRSTYVNIVRLVLTHKQVAFTFNDLETKMARPPISRCTPSDVRRPSSMKVFTSTRQARSCFTSMRPFHHHPCSRSTLPRAH
jgi:hypothetical protein